MPSDKFLKLPLDKKKILIDATKREFSIHKYEDASVNKIIKSINMPRGSFYLYFENKQDLYLYILKSYIKELKSQFLEILKKNSGNIFDSFISFYDKMIDNNSGEHDLINNMFINMNSKQIDIAVPQFIKEEIDGSIISAMNVDNYNILDDDKAVLLSILMPLFLHAVAISLEQIDKKNAIRVHYLKQLNIIKRGLERNGIC